MDTLCYNINHEQNRTYTYWHFINHFNHLGHGLCRPKRWLPLGRSLYVHGHSQLAWLFCTSSPLAPYASQSRYKSRSSHRFGLLWNRPFRWFDPATIWHCLYNHCKSRLYHSSIYDLCPHLLLVSP